MMTKVAVSLLAVSCAAVSSAQAQPAEGAPQEPSTPTSANPDASSVSSAGLEEIIVTAQRRSERLVDVPISVAAVSISEMERAGAMSLESLNKLVPGIYLQRDVYGLSPTVRGIGSTLSSSGGESNVSVYVDGVYLPFKATNIFDLASVSDVQVLKGPQGTLFGRNATGGAILITTLDPSMDPAARLRVSYERFGQARGSGYVNVPIAEGIAANAAVSYRHSDGYIRDSRTNDLVNEGEDYSGRMKFLWQPTDSLSIVLAGYLSKFDDPTGSSYQAISPSPFFSVPGIDANAGPIASDRFHRSHNVEDLVRTESAQYSGRVKWDLDFGTLQSMTSSQRSELVSVNDLDSTYQDLVPAANARIALKSEFDTFTQEVNLTSRPGSTLDYVAGLFYYRNRGDIPYLNINDVTQFVTVGHTTAKSAYFDGNYHLGDWVLIGGLRYTHETREIDTRFLPVGRGENVGSTTESVWTPRVGVRYELTPESNVYATYTRGYKAGIFDATSPLGNEVDPEYVNAYEIGYKTSSQDFTLNSALYYYDFTDTQVNAIFSSGGQIFQQLFNAPKSEIYGLDIDGTYRFNTAFDFRASVAYTHARYEEFTNALDYRIDPTDPASVFGLFYSSTSVDASGSNMVRAPEWSASAALNFHAWLPGDMRLDLSLSGAYSSRVYFNFSNTLSQPSYFLTDANATLAFNDRLSMSVFGRNLSDESYYTSYSQNVLTTAATFGMPRTYGVSLEYNF
ncbi:MAG TPA: TonB-dependent receptor [Steroidobacter sp.]|uniref:TonB-dependent receptor n=1 Tax=Steroidobacter sp. TaxID=1978227 RepID=UPI002EDB9118